LYIRPEFVSHKIDLLDGRTATGVVTAQSAESLTLSFLMNDKPEVRVMPRSEIDKVEPLSVSLMPEKMLDAMSHEEIRNLFAYVQSDPKPGEAKKKLRIALISGALEYKSDESLIGLQKLLEEKYPVECVRMFRKTDADIEGLDKLAECDLAIFFTRRLKPDDKQLALIKKYVESGKPILGIRTASHGFQNWLEMDKDVYGGNYKNHNPGGPKCEVTVVEQQKDHPILKGVKPFASASSLYKNTGVADDATVLLTGSIPKESEPLAWTRERKLGDKAQRVFYTSLGHADDFAEASFRRLIVNAIGWCLRDEKSFAE
jgi:type 1 glutamine amidotransferase